MHTNIRKIRFKRNFYFRQRMLVSLFNAIACRRTFVSHSTVFFFRIMPLASFVWRHMHQHSAYLPNKSCFCNVIVCIPAVRVSVQYVCAYVSLEQFSGHFRKTGSRWKCLLKILKRLRYWRQNINMVLEHEAFFFSFLIHYL